MKLAILLWSITGSMAYMSSGKDNFLSGVLLSELVNRIGKDVPDLSYVDFPGGGLPLGARSLGKEIDEEQLFPVDYDSFGDVSIHPSLRDQEFLEHSTLWGNQFMSGGAGEGQQLLRPEGTFKNRQEIKTDATLPAYCNPPNPCPFGYAAEHGCIEDFENTASFSRRYQAAQDCMCDTEHMFDCPSSSDSQEDDTINALNDLEFNRFLQRTMKINPVLQHKNLVAKKFNNNNNNNKKSYKINPFLTGERLPIAAKKGQNAFF